MVLISKAERTNVTIVGTISGTTVNFNFEKKTGERPQSINAGCNLPATVGGAQPSYINVSRQSNGQNNVSVNGGVDIADVAVLIEAIKAELEIVAMEGATV